MNNAEDRINDYINSHPRESIWLVLFVIMLFWQTISALIGLLLYVVLVRSIKVERWLLLAAASIIAIVAIYFSQPDLMHHAVSGYLKQGLKENGHVWKLLLLNGSSDKCVGNPLKN